jgi:hypothetical protein
MLSVTIVPDSISENLGTAVGTVTRNTTNNSQPLTVFLSSSDPGELSVPASVIIPAGASSITFDVTGVDDSLVDGSQTVTITATTGATSTGLDTTFGTDGFVSLPNYRFNIDPSIASIVTQADGKMLVVGRHLTIGQAWNVLRLNPDGTLDSSFGTGGIVTTTFAGTQEVYPQNIAVSGNGEILVV